MEILEKSRTLQRPKDEDHAGIRPISPTVLVEFLRIANLSNGASPAQIAQTVGLSVDRAREVSTQAGQMGLLQLVGGKVGLTESGKEFLQLSLVENFERVHDLLQSYEPLAAIETLLATDAYTVAELSLMTHYNQVAIETVLRLIKWTNPQLKRNRFKGTDYLTRKDQIRSEEFMAELVSIYSELANAPFNIRREYVKIPEVRAAVCEKLQIDGQTFDGLLLSVAQSNPNQVVLSSAPAPSVNGMGEKGLMSNGRHLFYLRVLH